MCSLDTLKGYVRTALSRLYAEDRDLLDRGVHEMTIACRFAMYLQEVLPGWQVDCEYNRDQSDVKRGPRAAIRPDIVVHQRGTSQNLLVIELKKARSPQELDDDHSKLEYLTSSQGRYRYRVGVSLVVNTDRAEWLWFSAGVRSGTYEFAAVPSEVDQ